MRSLTIIIYWASFSLLFYSWIGYPFLLWVLSASRKKNHLEMSPLPRVSVIIPAYNAAGKIESKISNTLALDYPHDMLEIIVVSDGSTDRTVELARKYEGDNVLVLELETNQGKSSAQNYAVSKATGEIIAFTDMESVLDSKFIISIVPWFLDAGVGCVGGLANLHKQDGTVSESHGLYWKVEQFIRRAESDLGMLHSLPGWGFAVRKSDFRPLDPDTGDDMILPLEIALQGKRSVIAPDALVSDNMPSSLRGELKARSRITLRNLTGLMRRKQLLAPWCFPRMAFALWSHKLLRWFTPFILIIIFGSTLWLYFNGYGFSRYILWIQIVFYSVGLIGVLGAVKGIKIKYSSHIASFLIANFGFLLGVMKFVTGHQISSYRNVR